MTTQSIATAFACTALACCVAHAADRNAGEKYVVASFGQSTYTGTTQADNDAQLTGAGLSNVQSGLSNNNNAFKFALGYRLNANFATEVSYMDLGSLGYNATYTGGSISTSNKVSGFNVSAVGLFPVNGELTLLGKVGFTSATVKGSGSSGNVTVSTSEDKTSAGFGVGAIYRLTDKLGLRLEWEKVYTDINLLTLGLQARF